MVRVAPVPQALVLPLPDRAAHQRGVLVEHVVVFADRAHRVVHRVGVFAHVERLGQLLVLRDLLDLRPVGVHVAVDVGGIAGAVAEALVVRRARGVQRLHGLERGEEVRTGPGLVAERPHHHRRVVLEVLDVGHVAVDVRGLGLLAVRETLRAVAVAVRFQVRLGGQVDAVLVAQLVPARVVGIVAGADVVAVALLEHLEVAAHLRLADGVAGVGPHLVAVRALELHGHAVVHVDAALDLHLAEAGAAGKDFRDLRLVTLRVGAYQRQNGRIQVGCLRRPLRRVFDIQLHRHGTFFTRLARGVCAGGGARHFAAFAIEERYGQAHGLGQLLPVVLHLGRHGQRRVLILRVEIRQRKEVANMDLRRAPEVAVAEDAGEPPHVLVLEPRAGAEAIDFHRDHVLARLDQLRHVELRGVAAVDAVADLLAVDPDEERAVHAAEREEHAAPVPVRGQFEVAAVAAHRVALDERGEVFRRFRHHAREIFFDDIAVVAVVRRAIAEHLPAGGHRDVLPAADVKSGFEEIQRPLVGMFDPVELPRAVEQPAEGRLQPLTRERLVQRGVGHQRRVVGLLVDAEAFGVFDLRRQRRHGVPARDHQQTGQQCCLHESSYGFRGDGRRVFQGLEKAQAVSSRAGPRDEGRGERGGASRSGPGDVVGAVFPARAKNCA